MGDEQSVGIESIILVMDALLSVGEDLAQALEDGKIGWAETVTLAKNLPAIARALVQVGQLPEELADLDDDERRMLVEHFADRFELDGEQLEKRIEQIFDVSVSLLNDVFRCVSIFRIWR